MAQEHSRRNFIPQTTIQYTGLPFFSAAIVLRFLTLIALLVFIIRFRVISQLHGNASGNEALPIKALRGSILSFIIFALLDIISAFCLLFYRSVFIAAAVVSEFHLVANFLAYLTLFHAFYQLVQRYLVRLAPEGKISTWKHTHLGFLIILSLLSIADLGLWTTYSVVFVVKGASANIVDLSDTYATFTTVRTIVFIASLEISYWAVVITFPRFFSHPFLTTTGTRPFIIASLSFLILNITLTILSIKYNEFPDRLPYPDGVAQFVPTLQSCITFLCIIGIYTGLMKCCKQWLQDEPDYTAVQLEEKDYPGTYLYQARRQIIAMGWRI